MKISLTRSLFLGLLLVPTVNAQLVLKSLTQSKSSSYVRTFGLTDANVYIDLQSSASNSAVLGSVGAHMHAKGGVRILGHDARALTIEGNANASPTSKSASMKIVVAGYTMLNETKPDTAAWSKNFGPYNLFATDPEIPVSLGIGTVTLSGNVGGGASLVASAIVATTPKAIVGGEGRVYGTGHVTVKYGVLGFSIGARADLRFLDTTVGPQAVATLSSLSGYLEIALKPLSIALRVFATIPIWGEVASKQVWSYALATISQTFSF